MCSNHIWPLLWLRALSRSLWPNYPVSIRSRQALQACLGNAWTRMWTFEYHRFTEWERQRHSVVLACVVAWFGNFAWMKKFVFFLHGRKLVLLPQRDKGCWLWIEVTWQSWRCMESVCDNVAILRAYNVASSQQMEFIVVKCWLVVQQRCKCVILALLHL